MSYIFHSFITFVDNALDCKANVILKRIDMRLSFKWNKSYSEVMDWIQARLLTWILLFIICLFIYLLINLFIFYLFIYSFSLKTKNKYI